ncbi:MAG: hypothetical protein K2X79_10930 [Burkholderiaceae bacterium]|nr:hypothetical protein [Burkholderiaceae bacterium]
MKPQQPMPPSDKRAPPSPKPYDGLLDPLPVPEVSESDTDTAWGLWEASVGGLLQDGKAAPEAPPPHGYEPTQPVGLDGEPPLKDNT